MSGTVVDPKCGTYAGYQRHGRQGTERCESCRAANREYRRRARRADPDAYADELARTAARTRALWRLAHEYPERFRELFVEEVSPHTFGEVPQ